MDTLIWLWGLVPAGAPQVVVAALSLAALGWVVYASDRASDLNDEIRLSRERGVEVPLALAIEAARWNRRARNSDKLREALAWVSAGRVPVKPDAEIARLRARVAELEAAKPINGHGGES